MTISIAITIIGSLISLLAALFAWSAKRSQNQVDANAKELKVHGQKLAVIEQQQSQVVANTQALIEQGKEVAILGERQRVATLNTAKQLGLEDIRGALKEEVKPLLDGMDSLQREVHSQGERLLTLELTLPHPKHQRPSYINGGPQ